MYVVMQKLLPDLHKICPKSAEGPQKKQLDFGSNPDHITFVKMQYTTEIECILIKWSVLAEVCCHRVLLVLTNVSCFCHGQ